MTTEMWIIAAFRILSALPVLRWPLAGAFIAIFADLSDLFLRDWLDLGGVKDYQRFDKLLDQAYMVTFLIVALRWEVVPRNIAIALFAFRLAGLIAFEISDERWVLILFPNAFEYWFVFVAAIKTFGWEEPWPRRQRKIPWRSGSSAVPDAPTAQAHQAQAITLPEEPISLTQKPQHQTNLTRGIRSWPLIGPLVRFAIPFRYSPAQLAVAFAIIFGAKLFHEYTLHVGQWFEGFTATEALEAIWRFFTPPY
jgi:hypothetical protein